MANTEPLIDDGMSEVVYYDGLTSCEVFHGVLRLKAFVRRKNPYTGTIERIVVKTFVRPVDGVMDFYDTFKRAERGELALN